MKSIMHFSLQFFLFVYLTFCNYIALGKCHYTPVVMYHGMGDTADGSIVKIKEYLQSKLTGIYVTSIQIGGSDFADFLSGFFTNLNEQVEEACKTIKADANLTNGYNAIGFSQGGQIIRAIAQRCPDPPMKNLISIGGQHQGVFGVPKCMGIRTEVCEYIRKMINLAAYSPKVQSFLVQAEYWHDPLKEDLYRNNSVFLADINNERTPRNEEYKKNLVKLENMILVTFLNDTIVQPKESGWFEFYVPGQDKITYKLKDSPLYKEDWIGLKQLDQQNKLKLLGAEGDHLHFTINWFEKNIVDPYLSK